MNNVNFLVLNRHLSHIIEIASSSLQDKTASVEIEKAVSDAIDSFSKEWNPLANLHELIEQLRFKAEVLKETAPKIADKITRASEIASQASVD